MDMSGSRRTAVPRNGAAGAHMAAAACRLGSARANGLADRRLAAGRRSWRRIGAHPVQCTIWRYAIPPVAVIDSRKGHNSRNVHGVRHSPLCFASTVR